MTLKPGFISLLFYLFFFSAVTSEKIRIAFLWSGPINDFGYNYRSEVARVEALIELEKYFGVTNSNLTIEGIYIQNLETHDATVAAIEKEIDYGTKLFVTNTGIHTEAFCIMAKDHPEVGFFSMMGCEGSPPNFIARNTRMNIGRYLCGTVCALHSKDKKYINLGFVNPVDSGPVGVAQVNAFYHSAMKINSDIKVKLIETEHYYDPILGHEAATLLYDEDVKCVASIEDTNSVQKLFAEKNLWSVGYMINLRYNLGESVLYSMIFPDKKTYVDYIKHFIENENKFAPDFQENYGSEIPEESGYSQDLGLASRNKVNEMREQFINEEIDVFCGEVLKDDAYKGLKRYTLTNGNECIDPADFDKITKYAEGVELVASLTKENVMKYKYFSVKIVVGQVFLALIILAMIVYIVILIDILKYRELDIYRAASPIFCVIIVSGLILGQIGLIFFIVKPSSFSCNMRIWLVGISLAFVYSALIFKNWRIMKIFSSKSLEIFKISNKDLLIKMTLPYILGMVIILTLWTSLDIFTKKEYTYEDRDILKMTEIEVTCSSKTAYGPGAAVIYIALLLIVGCIIAYKTRGITLSNYREAESTAWIGYNSLLVLIVTSILQIVLSTYTSVIVTDAILFFAIWFVLVADAILLFFPKMYRLHILKKTSAISTSSSKKPTTTFQSSKEMVDVVSSKG